MNKRMIEHGYLIIEKLKAINIQNYELASNCRDKERLSHQTYFKEIDINKLHSMIFGKENINLSYKEKIEIYEKLMETFKRSNKIKKIFKNDL